MSSLLLAGRSVFVITMSDRCFRKEQVDLSGPAVAEVLREAGAGSIEIAVMPDERDLLEAALRNAGGRVDLVVTTGGTGLAPRDITPEATLTVCDRLVPGLADLMRHEGMQQTPFAALGRGICGVCANTLILNLPGNPVGAKSSLLAVMPLLGHALDLLTGGTPH